MRLRSRRQGRIILILILALLGFSIGFAGAAEGAVNATVAVICPFYRNMTVMPVYVLNSNITFNYSLATVRASDCVIPAINGTLLLWKANGTPANYILSNTLYANNINATKKVYSININKDLLKPGGYDVNVSFSKKYYEELNSSPALFYAIDYANVIITNSSVTSRVSTGSPVTLVANMSNFGELSSTSNTVLHINVTGPYGFTSKSNYTVGPIEASGRISKTFLLYSVSPTPGTYVVKLNVTYSYNYTINGVTHNYTEQTSPTVSLNYTVFSPPHPPPKPVPKPPTSIANISYTSTPILVSLVKGQSVASTLSLYNHNQVPVWINLTEPNITGISLSFSSKSLYLLPAQGASVGLVIKAQQNATQGSSIIPIPETITAMNGTPTSYTQYVTAVIENSSVSKPTLLNTITSINSSKSIQGMVQVVNPTNRSIYNTTASVSIPIVVASTVDDISIAGAAGNVSVSNGAYNIEWSLPVLPAGTTLALYYTVRNASNVAAFEGAPVSFTVPSQVAVSSIRIFNIGIPTFYSNQQGTISISMLYSGTMPNNITLSLVGPPSVRITNNTQTFRVAPNTVLSPQFRLTSSSSGTDVITLYVSGTGISANYTFDLIVLPQPTSTTTILPASTTTIPQSTFVGRKYTLYGLVAAAAIIVIAASVIEIYKKGNRPRYSAERADRLKELKEHIGRGE